MKTEQQVRLAEGIVRGHRYETMAGEKDPYDKKYAYLMGFGAALEWVLDEMPLSWLDAPPQEKEADAENP